MVCAFEKFSLKFSCLLFAAILVSLWFIIISLVFSYLFYFLSIFSIFRFSFQNTVTELLYVRQMILFFCYLKI